MKSFKMLKRIITIQWILMRHGLDEIITSLRLFSGLRLLIYLNPYHWRPHKKLPRAVALRLSFEKLGPLFVKFGQALSTRPDLLPDDIALELSKLQDKVPSFPSAQALAIMEDTFGCKPEMLFAHFDLEPLASASMAQVHAATLKTGEAVVVKILRPNIRSLITRDIDILKWLARFMVRAWSSAERFKPEAFVQEFERSLYYELDLQHEAANASQLRRNFKNSQQLYVPEIYWDYTRENVLVMERIDGIPVSDIAELKKHHINIPKLAASGVEIFFTQVFRDCFFHADMHPGNIFVSKKNPENPQYICVDFGIIGALDEQDKRYLAENLYAFFQRDYRKVALLHIASGWISRDTRVHEFESAIRAVCEPIFEKPLKEISLAKLVVRLFQTTRQFNMQPQPQLILLQKTLVAVEGLGRQLYPELDLWKTAKPFLENWIKQQIGPRAFLRQLKAELPFLSENLPRLPQLIFQVLQNQQAMQTRQLMPLKPPQRDKSSTIWPVIYIVGILGSTALGMSHTITLMQALIATASIGIIGTAIRYGCARSQYNESL